MKNKKRSALDQDILVAVDTVVFTVKGGKLLTLLVKRKSTARNYPDKWSLPGGIVDERIHTSTEHTAREKLEAKTGIELPFLEQLGSYSGDKRDERKWSVSVVYFILMQYVSDLKDNEAVSENRWVSVDKIGSYAPFAFDHERIIHDGIRRLQEKTRYSLLPAYCLEEAFTLGEFHQAVEIILGHSVQKRSLYRRIEDSDALVKTGEMRETGTKKAALYRVNEKTRNYTFERNLYRS